MIEYRKQFHGNQARQNRGDMKIKPKYLDPIFEDFIRKNNLGIRITKAWVHYMDKGADYGSPHVHAVDTGVFYLQVNEKSGDLSIPEKNESVTPENGMLVIVPANDYHVISKNESEETRYALAFWFE